MGVNSVNYNTYPASGASASGASATRGTSALGKDEFLNLLITQLKYQDPLSPMDNTEYVAQLAQFSTLEQMNNMSNSLSSMEAFSMVGKIITAAVEDPASGEMKDIQGVVDSVKIRSGVTTLIVGGQEVKTSEVTYVFDNDRQNLISLSSMIGQQCKGYVYDSSTLDVINVEGTVAGIQKGSYEDYAIVNGFQGNVNAILSDDYKKSQTILEYLNDHIGKEVALEIIDKNTGKKVPIVAVVESAAEEGENVKATLNQVSVPVDSIFSIIQK